MTVNTQIVDLNAAFGKALLQQFFEPIPTGRGASGETFYAPSGVSVMAQELYRQQSERIREAVWNRLDVDAFAKQIADLVVADLVKVPGRFDYQRNTHKDELTKRVLEIVAQQLGQRVVDQMDLHLGTKELPIHPAAADKGEHAPNEEER